MIAVEPQTRRRMRVNGIAAPVDFGSQAGLRVHTDQVYSNCPKYISRRNIEQVRGEPARPAARHGAELDAHAAQFITAADTFFVGSADTDGNADASHRGGGNLGFLQVISPTRLRWPDYRGNSMFMTLGNIDVNPHCGLLIPDWRTGSTIQLTGTAGSIGNATTPPVRSARSTSPCPNWSSSPEASPAALGAAELSPPPIRPDRP